MTFWSLNPFVRGTFRPYQHTTDVDAYTYYIIANTVRTTLHPIMYRATHAAFIAKTSEKNAFRKTIENLATRPVHERTHTRTRVETHAYKCTVPRG